MRDRATQHLKQSTIKAMESLNLTLLEAFPVQSWDTNCMEHVWAQLAIRMRGRRPRTAMGLKRVIKEVWMAIQQSTIHRLIARVPNRIQKRAENQGRWIGPYQL
jgi:hypothetical protein